MHTHWAPVHAGCPPGGQFRSVGIGGRLGPGLPGTPPTNRGPEVAGVAGALAVVVGAGAAVVVGAAFAVVVAVCGVVTV